MAKNKKLFSRWYNSLIFFNGRKYMMPYNSALYSSACFKKQLQSCQRSLAELAQFFYKYGRQNFDFAGFKEYIWKHWNYTFDLFTQNTGLEKACWQKMYLWEHESMFFISKKGQNLGNTKRTLCFRPSLDLNFELFRHYCLLIHDLVVGFC